MEAGRQRKARDHQETKMEPHIFHRKYANLPLGKRGIVINKIKYGDMTLNDIYVKVKEIDDHIRPWVVKKENLLKAGAEGLELLK